MASSGFTEGVSGGLCAPLFITGLFFSRSLPIYIQSKPFQSALPLNVLGASMAGKTALPLFVLDLPSLNYISPRLRRRLFFVQTLKIHPLDATYGEPIPPEEEEN